MTKLGGAEGFQFQIRIKCRAAGPKNEVSHFMVLRILIAGLFLGSLAQAEECKHRILLVPQYHAVPIDGKMQAPFYWGDKITQSQFNIAKYLGEHKDLPIFSEQVSSDKSMETVSDEFKEVILPIVKELFPQGLPKNYADLSAGQKDFITRAGGDTTSLVLGQTSVLRRVVESDDVQEKIFAKLGELELKYLNATKQPPEVSEIIFDQREKLALDQVNNYFKANPKQRDVILIYGADHQASFRSHPSKFRAECILTPFEFQSVKSSSELEPETYDFPEASQFNGYKLIDAPTSR